ncbi:MAG: aminopeptidase P family protein [Caulobacterales bacterium]|nr:aminopeptidase P family protein [Caulobacterales bacterium]
MFEQNGDSQTYLQNFEVIGGKHYGQKNVPLLRAKLQELGVDGFLIPHEDEWQNEYLPASHDRLLYVTGFSGSAGFSVIMNESAHIFVDGRYSEQVLVQTDANMFEYHSLVDEPPHIWLQTKAKANCKIGYDARLFTPSSLENFEAAANARNIILVAMSPNPIDLIWENRPAFPNAIMKPQKDEYTGENAASKLAKISENLVQNGNDCVVLTAPMSIAWAFNIRGGDVSRTPLTLGSAIIFNDGISNLYVAPEKVTPEIRQHLGNGVILKTEADFEPDLNALNGKNVLVDNKQSSAHIFRTLEKSGAIINIGQDPTILPRAGKNAIEISGMQQAHIIDGVAMAKFLAWFDENAPKGGLNEISACKKLEEFRRESKELKDLSFDSISGAGKNAALPHYRVNTFTNEEIKLGSLFLIDSGGQYLCGTTDITRTISVGEISPEMKDRFTRVLKGHIALSRIKFPANTPGCMLDTLARMSLWDAGLDYDHGTGHGVGAYLGVHEGPQRIAKVLANIPLIEGMILSNEPGFYKPQEFGIRTENLQYVTKAEIPKGGERPMHRFETLTLAPIDVRAIDISLLSKDEIDWLNNYHARVFREIGPYLDGANREWLLNATKAI